MFLIKQFTERANRTDLAFGNPNQPTTTMERSVATAGHRGRSLKTHPAFRLLAGCLTSVLAVSASAQSINFTDNFESGTLNPFWTRTETAGSITFPSTVQAHSGSQSVQFNSLQNAGEKYIWLGHPLAQPGYYGDVSLWVYDTGADVQSANYLGLYLGAANFLAFDYDLGANNGGNYTYNLAGGASVHTSIDRTVGWHQFSAHSEASVLTLAIDGTTVYSGRGGTGGTPITDITYGMSGPTWRPARTSYFDDFSAALTPVPEPSTISLAFLGLAGIWLMRCRKVSQRWRLSWKKLVRRRKTKHHFAANVGENKTKGPQ